MSLSTYQASVGAFVQGLEALAAVLAKAAAHAENRKIEPAVFCQARLFPDMFAFARQVQLTCDFAKNASARLAGQEPPKWSDEEQTIDELQGRIARTLAFVKGLPRDAIEEGAGRSITIPLRGQPTAFTGADYLLRFALPNFYFHGATAYDILRANGVELGKSDFVGKAA